MKQVETFAVEIFALHLFVKLSGTLPFDWK